MLPTLVVAGWLVVAEPAVEVKTLDGRTLAGELTELSAEQAVVRGESPTTLKVNEVLSIAPQTPPEKIDHHPAVWLELTDGSRLTGQEFMIQKRTGRLVVSEKETVEIPTRSIRFVRFSPSSPSVDEAWNEALKTKVAGDLLVVRKKEAIDFSEGVVGGVTGEKVEFELDKEPLEVPRRRVDGIIFAPTGKEPAAGSGLYEDASGWRLVLKSVTLDQGNWKIVTASGATVTRPLSQLRRLDFSSGKMSFLSDLDWESMEHSPYFALNLSAQTRFNEPRRDRAFESGKLALQGKPFAKGLCVKSRTQIVYRLPNGFRTFNAVVGIDDTMRNKGGHVRLVISADNKTLFDEAIGDKDPPKELALNLSGAARLKIVVDYGENQDVADHLDLCDARIQK